MEYDDLGDVDEQDEVCVVCGKHSIYRIMGESSCGCVECDIRIHIAYNYNSDRGA